MRIGYARVSTEDQTLDLQKDTLKRAKCREIYEEQASGKNTGRPQLEGCLKSLREGDTLVLSRLGRLGRSFADLVRLIAELEQRKNQSDARQTGSSLVKAATAGSRHLDLRLRPLHCNGEEEHRSRCVTEPGARSERCQKWNQACHIKVLPVALDHWLRPQ